MPIFVALVKFNGAGPLTEQQKFEQGLQALGPAYATADEAARASTTGSGYYGAFWTKGESDMILMFARPSAEKAEEHAKTLEGSMNASIRLVRTLTEGEKERVVAGKRISPAIEK